MENFHIDILKAKPTDAKSRLKLSVHVPGPVWHIIESTTMLELASGKTEAAIKRMFINRIDTILLNYATIIASSIKNEIRHTFLHWPAPPAEGKPYPGSEEALEKSVVIVDKTGGTVAGLRKQMRNIQSNVFDELTGYKIMIGGKTAPQTAILEFGGRISYKMNRRFGIKITASASSRLGRIIPEIHRSARNIIRFPAKGSLKTQQGLPIVPVRQIGGGVNFRLPKGGMLYRRGRHYIHKGLQNAKQEIMEYTRSLIDYKATVGLRTALETGRITPYQVGEEGMEILKPPSAARTRAFKDIYADIIDIFIE